jgi:hypothetical protein
MYVYVNKKIDNMITITSQRGKINLVYHEKGVVRDGESITHVKVSAALPIWAGSYHAEKATIAGICRRHT